MKKQTGRVERNILRLLATGSILVLAAVAAVGFISGMKLLENKKNRIDNEIVAMRAVTPQVYYREHLQELLHHRAELANTLNILPSWMK